MTKIQELFLMILSASLDKDQSPYKDKNEELWKLLQEDPASWQALFQIAKEQALSQIVNDYLLTYGLDFLSKEMQESLQSQMITAAGMYYRMVNFVFKVLSLAKQEQIHCCILKGVGLGIYYPKEELRKTGDVDLYIPVPEELERFCRILKEQGFQQEKNMVDHHLSFFYISSGIKFELELHKQPINSQENADFNNEVRRIFEPFTKAGDWSFPEVNIINGMVPVLPEEEMVFYLLLHILQHFLSGGMGLRLLCDWVVVWKYKGQKKDFSIEKYLSFVQRSKIEGFHYMITGLCITFLGLPLQDVSWINGHMPKREAMNIFLKDIFDGGEFGEQDSARMLIALEKPGPVFYCKELHRQMRLRFQKAGKFPFLWPFLWTAAGVMFLYNNKFLRKTSTKQVVKSAKERAKLLDEIRLFQNYQDEVKLKRKKEQD